MPIICKDIHEETEAYSAHFQQFPYELSPFQKHAIQGIVDGNHVLVCAPTGSGKTLPAEFAIRYFVGQGKKVVYTSPIKALSNQKFHEFSQKFPDISIGLCTGDIKTNPTADVMIMTAEILNNALIRHNIKEDNLDARKYENESITEQANQLLHFQMDIDTELAAIIMDEVHYINDASRGHLWEQSIIHCPCHVQLIMLSATLDGPEKFAQWIESTCSNPNITANTNPGRQVVLAQTNKRIVPLTHYAFIPYLESIPKIVKDKAVVSQIAQSTNRLICLQTAANVFQDEAYYSIANTLKLYDKYDVRVSPKYVFGQLVKFMKGQEDPSVDDCLLPAIVFVLSRNQVERYAEEVTASLWPFDSKAPYTIARECEQILHKLPNWREYIELPEYKTLVRNLEKGVATHHSGMIPVLREIVEILIGRKMVRLLFATESFAIGLDCPIRTAVFTSLSKFDGEGNRFFHSHEYTQMAGRAGRRGIDIVGNVIHLPTMYTVKTDLPSSREFRQVLSGCPQKLVSKFHIDYSMVLGALSNNNMDANTDTDAVNRGIRFAEKSMIRDELKKQHELILEEERVARKKYEDKLSAIESSLRTCKEACLKYASLKSMMPQLVNKKKKDVDRLIKNLEEEWKWIKDDAKMVEESEALKLEWLRTQEYADSSEKWLRRQVQMVTKVLETDGFVDNKLTALGWVASQIAEIHPLVVSRCIFLWDHMERFSTIQLIGWLSVFSDAKLPEEERATEPRSRDAYLMNRLKEMNAMYELYSDTERELGMDTGINYRNGLCFDLVDIMMDWATIDKDEDENAMQEAAKRFIQNEIPVSSGDFIKAVLKISAISKELRAMALNAGFVQFAAKLEPIDGLILKSIATTQSLYV